MRPGEDGWAGDALRKKGGGPWLSWCQRPGRLHGGGETLRENPGWDLWRIWDA